MSHVTLSFRSKLQRRARRALVSTAALLSIATILVASSPLATAMTQDQRRSYAYEGITFIDDPCAPAAGGGAAVAGSINGSPDAGTLHSKFHQHVIDSFFFFIKQGFTPAQAAGIVGNLMQESTPNIDPLNTDGVAHGIAQWQDGRLTKMYAWVAANYGGDKNSFVGQLNYIMVELKASFSSTLSAMKTLNNPEQAAQYWNAHFEISADTSSKRADNARAVYNAATQDPPKGEGWVTAAGGSIVAGTDSGGGCIGGTGGSPNCQAAVGTQKILCEAKKYNGIFYSFGAGHGGYDSFRKGCPSDSVSTAASKSTEGNPGPCATDCSSLVSIALDEAYGIKKMWSVGGIIASGSGWNKIDMTSVQAGDIVTVAAEHVEVVDYFDPKTKVLHTFGSHHTGTRTSASTAALNSYDQAWRWGGA